MTHRHEVLDQLLACVPMRFFSWEGLSFVPDCQKALLDTISKSKVYLQFPPSVNYQLQFFKHLMRQVESREEEVIEDIYEKYGELVSIPSSNQLKREFRSYNLGSQYGYVTLQESVQLVSEGTTGLHTWEAAFCFLEWLLDHSKTLENKNVLELGSGAGLVGVSVVKVCHPATLTLSDRIENVLQLLRENVKLNLDEHEQESVEMRRLDWSEAVSYHNWTHSLDYIIATDVVFEIHTIDHLVLFLDQLWSVFPQAILLINSVIRKKETYQYFLTSIDQLNVVKKVCQPTLRDHAIFYYDRTLNYEILEIRKLTDTQITLSSIETSS